MIKVVFFDAGDTLLRPFPSFQELFAVTCRRAGYDVDANEVLALRTRLAPHLVDLAEETGIDKPSLSAEESRSFWRHLYRRFLEELGVTDDDLVDELYSVFSNSASYKLFDDVVPSLEQLVERGYRLGLISNFEEWLQRMLVELEIHEHFEPTVISGLEGVEKPDPVIYQIAVERAGVDPSEAVHVGDSPKLDVEPASSVGLHAVLLDRFAAYPGATVDRIRSLEELPGLIENF
ncbi:MAG TPA: HAD-IA family hydrolase [Actinomycetota bacterium]|nr:HAD-IA family hydrolase [Actinomycetota bacterium]